MEFMFFVVVILNKIKSDRYYYDVTSDTIHAPEFTSRGYFHEERHAKDMSMKWYRKLNTGFDLYLQFYCFAFIPLWVLYIDEFLTLGFLPYIFFRLQEEGRAYYYAYEKTKK